MAATATKATPNRNFVSFRKEAAEAGKAVGLVLNPVDWSGDPYKIEYSILPGVKVVDIVVMHARVCKVCGYCVCCKISDMAGRISHGVGDAVSDVGHGVARVGRDVWHGVPQGARDMGGIITDAWYGVFGYPQ
jgi:hypothetical protein